MAAPWTPNTGLLHSILDSQVYTGPINRPLVSLPEDNEPAIAFSAENGENDLAATGSNSSSSNYPSIFSMRSETSSTTAQSELGFDDFRTLPPLTEENFAQLYRTQTMSAWTPESRSVIEVDMAIGTMNFSSPLAGPHSDNQAPSTLASNMFAAPIKRTRKPRQKRQPPCAAELQKKREAFLRRNRIAAGKCRDRQRKQISSLETRAREAQDVNAELEAEYQKALDEVMILRQAVKQRSGCCGNWDLSY